MKSSYIAFHKKKGIYLGVIAGYALFSTNNIVFSSKAIKFVSKEEIREFFDSILPKLSDEIRAIKIQTESTNEYYIDVADILKSGHTEHTESMIDNIPTINETIH